MITINITYYNEPHLLKYWYKIAKYAIEQEVPILLQVCDDGSQREPVTDFFETHPPLPNISVFRVKQDIGFNSHGCRNLLMKHTTTEWNWLTDIDREYTRETFINLANLKDLQQKHYYSFLSINKKSYSLNDYVIHKDDFWSFGGYDEEFVNVHWGDRIMLDAFNTEIERVCRSDLRIAFVRGARKVGVSDVDTTQYPDDNTLLIPRSSWWRDKTQRESIIAMVQQRYNDPVQRQQKPILNFEWEKVF